PQPAPASPPRPAPGETAKADYFDGATSIPRAFAAKVGGPVRVTELVVYPGYVIAEIQNPHKRENLDRYTLRDGVVGDGDPVMLGGRMKTAADVDDAVVDLASANFTVLPAMVRETRARLDIEGGKVTHAIFRNDRTFGAGVGWRVYASGPRRSGSVE